MFGLLARVPLGGGYFYGSTSALEASAVQEQSLNQAAQIKQFLGVLLTFRSSA